MRIVWIGALGALLVVAGVAQAQGRGGREGGSRRIPPEVLKKYDKNGDGKLDRAELRQMMADRRAGEGEEGRGRGGRGGRGEGVTPQPQPNPTPVPNPKPKPKPKPKPTPIPL